VLSVTCRTVLSILGRMKHSLRANTVQLEQHLLSPLSLRDRRRAERMAEEARRARFKRQPLSGRDYAEKPQKRTRSIIDGQCPQVASALHGNHVVSAGPLSESRNKQGRGLYRAEIAGVNARYARVSYVDRGEFDVSRRVSDEISETRNENCDPHYTRYNTA
jgi:hypothetical protein